MEMAKIDTICDSLYDLHNSYYKMYEDSEGRIMVSFCTKTVNSKIPFLATQYILSSSPVLNCRFVIHPFKCMRSDHIDTIGPIQ